jgi:DNA-directed RNA polymerase specialized sigma24 family protein
VLLVLGRFFIQLGRKRREEPREDLVEQAEGRNCDGGALASVEVNDILGTLLRGDPLRERKVRAFTGYWLERRTQLELAEAFGVSVSTIHRWLGQVREAFSRAVGRAS